MPVAIIFNLVGLALVAFSFTVFKVAVGGIHEVYGMLSLGFGLLTMAVASGTGAIVHAIRTARSLGSTGGSADSPPPRAMTEWDRPRASAGGKDADTTGNATEREGAASVEQPVTAKPPAEDPGQSFGNWGGRRRLPDSGRN